MSSLMSKPIKTYSEFWPYYLQEHAQPATRVYHYLGVIGLMAVVLAAFISGNFYILWLMPIVGYGFAWFSHLTIEKNKPATFDYPFWSLISDFRMFYCWLTGQMNDELKKAGVLEESVYE